MSLTRRDLVRAAGAVALAPRVPLALAASGGNLPQTREMLEQAIREGDFAGAVAEVEEDGRRHELVLGARDGAGHPMRADAIFSLASMTKPIVTVLVLGLVEEGKLALDEPVDAVLPELAHRRVLRRPEGPLDDTVAATRPITLRDLLTFRCGYGIFGPGGPFQQALRAASTMRVDATTPEAYLGALSQLPLQYQPGQRWLYDSGLDIAGVLVERRMGRTLDVLAQERLLAPLGMHDTGFFLSRAQLGRRAEPVTRAVAAYVQDVPAPVGLPSFRSGAHGLYSTAGDYMMFARALLRPRPGVVSATTVKLMATDSMTAEDAPLLSTTFADGRRWGMGLAVQVEDSAAGPRRGAIGWAGALGTYFVVDPAPQRISLLMMQRYPFMPEPLGGPPPRLAATLAPNATYHRRFCEAAYRDPA